MARGREGKLTVGQERNILEERIRLGIATPDDIARLKTLQGVAPGSQELRSNLAKIGQAAQEDIVLPKLVRTIGALERSPYLGGSLPAELEPLSDEWIAKRLKKIGDLREEAMYKPGDIDLAQQVRLVSDVYDMRVLAEIVGLNESYWNKAEKDWDVIQRNPKLKERILGVILPDFAHY